jgi:lysophospholipase L1-like esterase
VGNSRCPPQLDAVTPETQLVTVTIGGNDVFFMANLIAMSCDRSGAQPATCTVRPDAEVEARFAGLANSLRKVVTGARRRSPNVRVVFVTYFTVLPEQGTCPRVALTVEQAHYMRGATARLLTITRQVAQQTGAGLLDVSSLSRTHNGCSSDPWVAGAHREQGSLIPPFHPTLEAMRAVAAALNDYLALPH